MNHMQRWAGRSVRMSGLAKWALIASLAMLSASVASAEIDIGTLDASDGVLDAADWTSGNTLTIDLGAAVTGSWGQASAGNGVYDPNKWAVVFKYSSVTVPSGKTLTFKNHPSGAPVVWLVQESVTVAGTVQLSGANGTGSQLAPSEPGPGGFRGGAGYSVGSPGPGAGIGPGGATISTTPVSQHGSSGGYATSGQGPFAGVAYGNEEIIPLIGGSGGASPWEASAAGAGAGGGALLLACRNSVTLTGSIIADGGGGNQPNYSGGGGSGGGIRLIADVVSGVQSLFARGGTAGANFDGAVGRIRVESNQIVGAGVSTPPASTVVVGSTGTIWPPASAPTVRVVSVGGIPVPADPAAEMSFPAADLVIDSDQPQSIVLETRNVPLDWIVSLRINPKNGPPSQEISASLTGGNEKLATWTVTATLNNSYSSMQAKAKKP